MYFRQETITPDIARSLLDSQVVNRSLNSRRVIAYANDMKNGNWKESPEPICMNPDGKLNNGQHRLQAVILSGTPVVMTVAYDVPDEAVMDRGLPRSVGDSLYMRGLISAELSTQRVMSMVNRYLEIKTGCSASMISDMDKANFINDHEEDILFTLRVSEYGIKTGKLVCYTAGARAAILGALICGVDRETITRFANVANSGFMEKEEDAAAVVFRNFAMSHVSSGGSVSKMIASVAEMSIRDFAAGRKRRRQYRTYEHCYIQNAA